MEKSAKKRWVVLLYLAILLVAIALGTYLERAALYKEMNALDLVPTPERFTELSFTDPATLPRATVANQITSFSFTINNREGVTMMYPYDVYFQPKGGQRLSLAEGTTTLADGESTTIPVSYTFTTSTIAGEVVVDLPSLNDQQIDFLLPYNN